MPTVVTVTEGPPDTLALRFVYDEACVAVVKRVPGRVWDKAGRRWLVPATYDTLDMLSGLLRPFAVRLDVASTVAARMSAQRHAIEEAARIVRADDADTDFPFVTAPYAHQRAGLGFLQRLGSGGLLWEMGLGKTKTAIDYAEWLVSQQPREPLPTPPGSSPRHLRVLVVCPNTVRDNWVAEIRLHAGHEDVVVPAGTLVRRATQVGTRRYTVVNVEALSSGPFAKALMAHEWDLVVVDESTRFKNPRAQRTRALMRLRARHRVILTGTPLTNTPEDLWTQLTFLRPGILGSWWSFRERYLLLDWFGNVTGTRPDREAELTAKVRSWTYRRLKSEVLDLPPKVYQDRLVGLSDVQREAYRTMRDEMRMVLEGGDQVLAMSILAQLLRLTQVTAGIIGHGDRYDWDATSPKLAELDWLLGDELRGRSVVVFGLYRRELEELARRYAVPDGLDGHPPILYGPTPPAVRSALIEQFQAGARRLLFAQTRTGGVGINLTAAQDVIYHTRGWSLEDYLQSQDRLHRIGQQGTVTIVHLIAEGTIDVEIAKALAQKQDLADRLTGDAARRLAARLLGG